MFRGARLAVMAGLVVTAGFSIARADQASDVVNERNRFEGTWKVISVEKHGRQVPSALLEKLKEIKLVVRQGRLTVFVSGIAEDEQSLEINPLKRPRELNFDRRVGGNRVKYKAIYRFEAGLEICVIDGGETRPASFNTHINPEATLMTFIKE